MIKRKPLKKMKNMKKNRQALAPVLGLCLAAALSACKSSGSDDEPGLPPAIQALALSQIEAENGFTASWEPETRSPGLSYELFYSENTGTLSPPAAEASGRPVDQTETRISGLEGGKAYAAWVRAVLAGQKGPWSDPGEITLLKDQTSMTFSIEVFGQTRFAKIQGDSIQVSLPINTPRPWKFSPQIALAAGASLVSVPAVGEEADFSDPENPVRYQVKAENGRIQDYRVSMTLGDESGLGLILEPEEDLLTLSGPLILAISKSQTKVFTLGEEYQNCTWYVDGLLKGTTNALRLRVGDYKPGLHYLSVNGFKTYGEDQVPWSMELEFTVTQ
jgi:hypothetical protein